MTNVISRVTFRIFAMSKYLSCFGVEIKSIMYFTYMSLSLSSLIVIYMDCPARASEKGLLSSTPFSWKDVTACLTESWLRAVYTCTLRHAIQVLHNMRLVVSLV
jgi:hypothetical protein